MAEVSLYRGRRYVNEIISGTLKKKHDDNIRYAFYNHGKEVVSELEKLIKTGSRSGRTYIINGRVHTASAPFETPANRTGKLAKSFSFSARRNDMVVGSNAFSRAGAPYPAYLDSGTSKMAPRPFFLVTITRLQYRLQKELGRLAKE